MNQDTKDKIVSIHTPTKGVTPSAPQIGATCAVSIHTPTKGVTQPWNLYADMKNRFNPHTHEGCDSQNQSNNPFYRCFNPHTHEGCDPWAQPSLSNLQVSIHTPTKGVTQWLIREMQEQLFQSTHPRRV